MDREVFMIILVFNYNMLDNNTCAEATERFVSLEIMRNDLEVAESRIREFEAKVEELEGQLDSK